MPTWRLHSSPVPSWQKASHEKTGGKSDFAGFLLPNAALNLNVPRSSAPDDVDHLLGVAEERAEPRFKPKSIKIPRCPMKRRRRRPRNLVDQLFDIGDAAVKSGKIDAGAALILDPKALTFAAGGDLFRMRRGR